ncbi:MAG: hypothetical protein AAF495_03290 [Pseudomonadota bacterium]
MGTAWQAEARRGRIGMAVFGRAWSKRQLVAHPRQAPERYAARLGPHEVIQSQLHGRPLTLLAEPARLGASYGCGPRDARHLLSLLPKPDLLGLDLVVLRQPSRREEIAGPLWARCLYRADFGRHKGSALLLEAVHLGHAKAQLSEAAVRDTMLYDRLLRAVGLWVDWQKQVRRPVLKSHSRTKGTLAAAYLARPQAERAAAAERYAKRQATRLRAAGRIPFETLD